MEPSKQHEMMKLFSEYRTEEGVLGRSDLENARNTSNIDLFEAIIREAYDGVTMVVAGHHIMFARTGEPLPYEISSADTLIFDHYVASRIWKDKALATLALLAAEPAATRDALLRRLYFEREPTAV